MHVHIIETKKPLFIRIEENQKLVKSGKAAKLRLRMHASYENYSIKLDEVTILEKETEIKRCLLLPKIADYRENATKIEQI